MLVFVETSLTGSGLKFVKQAISEGTQFTFVSKNLSYYFSGGEPPDVEERLEREWLEADTEDLASAPAVAEALLKRGTPTGIVVLTDRHVEFAAELAEALRIPFLPKKFVHICRNKEALRSWWHDRFEAHFYWRHFADLEGLEKACHELPYPVILKNSRGSGSIQVSLCTDRRELLLHARAYDVRGMHLNGGYLIETYLPGPLFSAEVVIQNGKARILGITDRELGPLPSFCEIAASFPVPLSQSVEEKLANVLSALIEDFSLTTGQLHLEFVSLDDGFSLIEINPRLAGSLVLDLVGRAYDTDPYAALLPVFYGDQCRLPQATVRGAALRAIVSEAEGMTFRGLRNLNLLATLPGIDHIHIHQRAGSRISGVHDWSAALATITSHAPSAYLAAQTLRSVAPIIQVEHD